MGGKRAALDAAGSKVRGEKDRAGGRHRFVELGGRESLCLQGTIPAWPN